MSFFTCVSLSLCIAPRPSAVLSINVSFSISTDMEVLIVFVFLHFIRGQLILLHQSQMQHFESSFIEDCWYWCSANVTAILKELIPWRKRITTPYQSHSFSSRRFRSLFRTSCLATVRKLVYSLLLSLPCLGFACINY